MSQHDLHDPHVLRAAAIENRHARVDHATYVRRRIAVGAGVGVLAVAVVVLVTLVWPGTARHDAAPAAATVVTVTRPAPTATAKPAALPSGATALLRATPGVAGPWVRASAKPVEVDDATEAWDLGYQGPGDALRVRVAQYATTGDAQDAYAATAKGGSAGGDVVAGGKKAGTYAVVPGSDGQVRVVWRNGTVVLTATGPDGPAQQLYAAYSL